MVLSNRGAFLSGRVADEHGNPVSRARLFAIPATLPLPPRLYRGTATASATGDFRLGPLRGGEYFIVALPSFEPMLQMGQWERVARLTSVADRVTLGDLDERAIDLRLSGVTLPFLPVRLSDTSMTLLKVIQPGAAPPPAYVATGAPVRFADGFHGEESDGVERFRWMSERGVLEMAPDPVARYLEFWTLSEFQDLSQSLLVRAGGDGVREYPLIGAWGPLSVEVPAGVAAVELRASKIFPRAFYPGDARTLAVRVRDVRLHQDPERHGDVSRQYGNLRLNTEEILAGRSALASTPPKLGIDMHGACNVKPPCVYCEWDYSKTTEGEHVDAPFTRETLREWGPFFDNAVNLVNCSIGEPFMMKNLDELLKIFGRTGKTLEMATNGQILTERNVERLLDWPIDLYVSLDAATPLTYARLRNDTFEKILRNLRRLIAAKGGRGAFPRVHLVFMPMRCNLHELDDFVRLCADLGVDRLALRPLNYSDGASLDWERAGYRFQYKHELLPFEELVRVSGRAARLCQRLGVDLDDQMDFGGSMREMFSDAFARGEREADAALVASPPVEAPAAATAAVAASHETESARAPDTADIDRPQSTVTDAPLPSLGGETRPACLEPWKSLYILRRGVLPCCYGGEPVAPVGDHAAAWNSPLLQGIRRELLHGRFHDYCLRSPSCPIVRKSEEAALLPPRQRALMRARHLWWRFNRDTGHYPNRFFYLPLKRMLFRALHTARLVRRVFDWRR